MTNDIVLTEDLQKKKAELEAIKERMKKEMESYKQIKEELAEEEDNELYNLVSDQEAEYRRSKRDLSRVTKMRRFERGDNFSTFCDRFIEYVNLTGMEGEENLYMFLLQNVDDRTYTTLKSIKLTSEEKRDVAQFCKRYKKAIYGSKEYILKNALLSCKQKNNESIADYAYRLREKANVAYLDEAAGEENCILAFMRGIKNKNIRRDVNAKKFEAFEEAVEHAEMLEDIDTMMEKEETPIASILKQISLEMRKKDEDEESSSSSDREDARERRNRYRGRSQSPDRRGRQEYRGQDYNRGRSSSGFRREGYKNPDRNITCGYCNKLGHVQDNCWSRPDRRGGYQQNFQYSGRVNYQADGLDSGNGGPGAYVPDDEYVPQNSGRQHWSSNNQVGSSFNSYQGN